MSAAHRVKAVKGERIPGTWRAICSCGWQDWMLYGAKGARTMAVAAAHDHAEMRQADQ